jgi:hypothetical protein
MLDIILRFDSCSLGVLNAATQCNAPANSPVYGLYSVTLRNAVTGKLDDCAEGVGAGLGARHADGVIIDPWTGEIDAKQTARVLESTAPNGCAHEANWSADPAATTAYPR